MKITIFMTILVQVFFCSMITPQHFRDHIQGIFSQQYQLYNIELGKTVNNNPLTAYVLTKIDDIGQNFQKLYNYPASLITSYMHPRQQYTINTISSLINKIGADSTSDYYIQYLLEKSLIIFFPFVNIDGYYRYLELKQTGSPKMNQYRKNMHMEKKCPQQWQQGVDINRNFDYSFGTELTSDLYCSQQYRGSKPFSQKQSLAIKKLYSKFNITIAIDVHSYGNQWIYPYASDPTGLKIKQNKLYPFYLNIINQFKGKRANIKGCLESLGYTADGVYIDWALECGALAFAFQVGSNFDKDSNINDQVEKSLDQFYFILKKNSITYKIYQNQSSIIIQSLSLLNLKIKITSFQQGLSKLQIPFDLLAGQLLVVQQLKNRQKFIIQVVGSAVLEQIIVKDIGGLSEKNKQNLRKQANQENSLLFIVFLILVVVAGISTISAISYWFYDQLNKKKKKSIKLDYQEILTLRKAAQ